MNKKWYSIINIIIQNAILNEAEDQQITLSERIKKLLRNKKFRRLMTSELSKAKKSFAGMAGSNLDHLYVQCGLEADSLEKLRCRHWHLKAQGIQELAILDRKEAFNEIYQLTNDSNEQVRMEAQNAVVELSGFEGLKFLDFLTYALSDWQQINLLNKLGEPTELATSYIGNWLSSKNNSVAIFSLKLASKLHDFELHEKVLQCITHPNSSVRYHAIHSLKEIYTEETAKKLIIQYENEDLHNKLAILEVLQVIGTDDNIQFLLEQFEQENNLIKIKSGRAIADIEGITKLENSALMSIYPWSVIIQQIKVEKAA